MELLDIGNAIRIARVTRGLSISEFALLMSRSVAHMTRIELNKQPTPLIMLYKICEKLEFEVIEIVLLASESTALAKIDCRLVEILASHYLRNMVNLDIKTRIRNKVNILKQSTIIYNEDDSK